MSNLELVNYLVDKGYLRSAKLIKAFQKVDRKDFVGAANQKHAYLDTALSIGFGQTISQPLVVAFMLEILDIQAENTVLDIGTGSGYTTTLISQLINDVENLIGLERIPDLVLIGNQNLTPYLSHKFESKHQVIALAKLGLGLSNQKFDRILVSAAAESLPHNLVEQLNPGGKMAIPINNSIFLVEKKNNRIQQKEFWGFSFVPLIHKE